MAQKTFLLCCFAVGCIFGIAAQLQCTYERDEAAAGRNCERACRTDGTCRKQNRECICDGRCGPVCLRKTCPALAQPGNGSILINPSGRFIGSEATYSCDDGFQVVGNSARICQGNKTWNGTEPTCQKSTAPIITTPIPVTCERLPSPLNGREILGQQNGDVVAVGTMVRFQCNDGYVRTSGSLRRICREDGRWSGSDAVCSAVAVEQCARDDQEIQNQNRRCMRPCESSSDCLRGRPCVCDDICGLSCIPIDRTDHCEDLPSDQSVRVRITPNDRTFGSTAQYECRSGHEEDGGSHERKCVGSGQWSGVPLSCIPRVRCGQPPETANSAHNGTKAYYVNGDIVIYRCNYGYYRSGYLPLSRCSRDEWTEIQFQCLPKSCGDPGHILNGRRIGSSFVFLGSVEFMCNPGYEMRGLSRRYCQADQQWSGSLPTCHPIRCPDPGVPDYGIKIGSDYSYDEIVSFECNTRYILEGQSSLRCQANGTWNAPPPTCRLIRCRRPEEPRNGHSTADMEYYGQQGIVRFTCDNGYTLRGSSVITCDEHEQWSPPPPLCLGRCRIPSCPSHGQWTVNTDNWYRNCRSNQMVDPGFRLTYQCDNGYIKCQEIEPVCNDRVWEPDTRNLCIPRGCSSLILRDTRLIVSYTYRGANECYHPTYHQQETVVEYSCPRGYKIRDRDPSQATCRGRSWVPQHPPVCVEVTCPDLQFPHGSITYQQNGPFTSNRGHTATARFRCIEGYRLEGHTIFCDNGVWNNTIPTCVEEPCSVASLEWYNMDVQYEVPPGSSDITAGFKPPDTIANFVCLQHGFQASQTKICERGRWRGVDPECLRMPCDHERLENAVVSYTLEGAEYQRPVHDVIRRYTCNAGYTISDPEPSQCDAGSWTRGLPVCNERPCTIHDLLSDDWYVEYNYPERRNELAEVMKPPGTVARLTCNRIGYVTAGINTRTCARGEWDQQNPSCVRRTCPLIQLAYGTLEYRDIDNIVTSEPRHGDSVRATCNIGYYLQGALQRLCWDGQWENGELFCLERSCNTNDLLDGILDREIQYYNLQGRNVPEQPTMSPGTVARLRCNATGYVTMGENRRTCRRGEWTGQNPSCERRTCQPMRLDNGRFEYRDSDNIAIFNPLHGDFSSATCNRGYYLQGPAETQCWDGQWIDELPTCQEKPCDKNDLPIGDWEIEFNYPGGRDEAAEVMKSPGTLARFRCNVTGYAIDGDDTRECTLGQWEGPRMSCERSICQTPLLADGRLRYYESDNTRTLIPRHGDYRIASCNDGYSLEGTSRTQCLEGDWIEDLPTCQENPCSFLNETEVPDYLQVTYATARARGSRTISSSEGSVPSRGVATFTCRDEGFVVRGESQRTCKKGTWRGEFPECVIAHCSVESIVNGGVTRSNGDPFTQEASHGDRIRFTCDQGYTLDGEEISQCSTGEWIPIIPTCVEARCQAVENNGEYKNILYQGFTSDAPSFPANTFLEVVCADGRVHDGPGVSECRRGSWEPSIPLCVQAAACEEVPQEEGRTVTYTENPGNRQHSSVLVVTCADNMVRFGQNSSTCLNGTWSPPVARCKENYALNKPAYQDSTDFIGNANLAVDGNTDGSYLIGRSCSHTRNDARTHWWYVDLGSSILVTEVLIFNRQDGHHHTRLLNAKVRVGENTRNVFLNGLAGMVTETESNPIRIEVNPAIRGNIVSISEVTRGNPLTLCEVQVFGELPACPNGCEVPPLDHGYFTTRGGTQLHTKTCVTSNSEPHIYAHCQDDWNLAGGSHYYTCQQTGEWLNNEGVDLSCQLCSTEQCTVPFIENGHFESDSTGTTLTNGTCLENRAYIRVVCDDGMPPTGSEYYLCSRGEIDTRNADNAVSSCSLGRHCSIWQCVVPYIENGHYSATRDGTPLGEGTCLADRRNLFVVCNDGMQLHGSFYYQCNGGELLNTNNDNVLSTCSRVSNEQEQRCPNPGVTGLVETFAGSDFTPINRQEIFREGDFITSRCQNPKNQTFIGSVTRFCEGGGWTGDPPECESTNFVFSVSNTIIQNVTENGTLVVYPVRGYVDIKCVLRSLGGLVTMHYHGTSSFVVGAGVNRYKKRIYNPSSSDSGKYRCESNGQSHSITILFKAINCPPPPQPSNWDHNKVPANDDGTLGYIFTETLSLICPHGYTSSNPIPNKCTYRGTWSNMSQRCIREQRP